MNIAEIGRYLLVAPPVDPERHMFELKRVERIFIGIRWVGVPFVFLIPWLHRGASLPLMLAIGAMLVLGNGAASLLNPRIKRLRHQQALGLAMLTLDTLATWGFIFLFVLDFNTPAYTGFAFVIIEAAIRFSLAGSLVAIFVFAAGLYATFVFRALFFDSPLSLRGYAFWAAFMSVLAVWIGAIVREGRKQRQRNDRYLRESALLSERHRIARDMHDTVLKTLQGLILEARALGGRTSETVPSVKDTARYIEEVCARTSQEIREVIFALRADSPAGGIGAALSQLLEGWSRETGIPAEFSQSGPDMELQPEPARQLRNVVSEALTNVQRHAAASRVRLFVKSDAGLLDVEVSDDGHGMGRIMDDLEVYVAQGKLGLAGMKERMELLGGSLSVASDSHGTRVSLRTPVQQHVAAREQRLWS